MAGPTENSTTNRDGYREYKSDPKVCASCPSREKCTKSKSCVKTVTRHIWKDYEDLAEDARHTPFYARMYKLRKETIERVFADAKEKHAMRYTTLRGLAQVRNWVKLKASPHNCVCGLRPIFCPIRAAIKGGNTYSIPTPFITFV